MSIRRLKNRNAWVAPFDHNWSSGVKCEVEYMTDVIRHRQGQEQRHAIRQEPRINMDITGILTETKLQVFRAEMVYRQTHPFAAKTPWRRVALADTALAGATEIELESAPFWVQPGVKLILEDLVSLKLATVASVDGTTVTLEDPLDETISGTHGRAHEAHWYYVPDEIGMTHPVDGVATFGVDLLQVPGSGPISFMPQDRPDYNSLPLFMDRPNWASSVNLALRREREVFDPGMHRSFVWSPVDYSEMGTTSNKFEFDRDKAENALGFFAAMRGKQGAFWAPDWTKSFEHLGLASGRLRIPGPEFRQAYEGSPVFDRLIHFRPDGTYQINRVVQYHTVGEETRLQFANAWQQPITASSKLRWLLLQRFATDKITPEWLTSKVCQIQMATTTLRTSEVSP